MNRCAENSKKKSRLEGGIVFVKSHLDMGFEFSNPFHPCQEHHPDAYEALLSLVCQLLRIQ